jgi:type III secretion protein U
MAGDSSEEKTLPASQKKLREARKKGQVARSKDLNSATALIGGAGVLILGGGGMLAAMTAMLDQAGEAAAGDFNLGLAKISGAIETAFLHSILPVALIVPIAVVLTSIVVLQGVPFAVDPVTPKFERINPAEGLKKLFAMRALMELVKSIVKAIAIGAVLALLLIRGINPLVLAPSCGTGCVGSVFHDLAIPLLTAAALIFLVAGLADVGLQRWLFMRDQKMSVSEAKRERKDMDGDPILKQERRRLMNEARRVGAMGMRRATAAITDGRSMTIGLRFKAGETPVPIVVCRGRNARAGALQDEATGLDLPVIEDAEVAELLAGTMPGQFIPQPSFRAVAVALARANGRQ